MNISRAVVLFVLLALGSCGYQIQSADPGAYFETYALSGDTKILACQAVVRRLERAGLSKTSGGDDKKVQVWALTDAPPRLIHIFEDARARVPSVAFSK